MKPTLILSILGLLCGCTTPMTYDDMNIAYETAVTPEEKKIAEDRLNKFEENVKKADLYFQERAACDSVSGLTWYCDNAESANLKRIKTIEAKVRAWKREYHYCQCANADAVMRELQRAMY